MTTQAHAIMRALRRTMLARDGVEGVLTRLMDDVQPSNDDLLVALALARDLPADDPARLRIIALLELALQSGLFGAASRSEPVADDLAPPYP